MADKNNLNVMIGQRIKYIRKKKKLTLRQVSSEIGLSVGYLSNLERSVISPTIDQLQKICSMLEVNITDILANEQLDTSPLIKADERKLLFSENERVKYELLAEGENDLEGICITMEKDVDYEKMNWGHGYDEIGIVVEGKLVIEMLEAEYLLEKGDSFYIKKNTLHTFKNVGKEVCISYWFYIKQND